jgi:hypothetical protein
MADIFIVLRWSEWERNIGERREGLRDLKGMKERKKGLRDKDMEEIIPCWISAYFCASMYINYSKGK